MDRFDSIFIFSDYDNTLTSLGKKPSDSDYINPKNIEAVKRFVQKGGTFVMATGRNPKEVVWLKEIMPIADEFVCINGSFYSIPMSKVIKSNFLDDSVVGVLKKITTERKLKHFRIVDANLNHNEWHENSTQTPMQVIESSQQPFYKITFSGNRDVEYSNELLQYLKDNFGSDYMVEASFVDFLELYSKTAGKHTGVIKYAQEHGAKHFICVGDQENDIKMLKNAEIAVCVGDGTTQTKNVAQYICAPSVDGAIADVIRMLENDEIKFD